MSTQTPKSSVPEGTGAAAAPTTIESVLRCRLQTLTDASDVPTSDSSAQEPTAVEVLCRALLEGCKASHGLPDVDGDRVFLQGDREFQARTQAQGERILGLASKLVEQFKPSLANNFRTELQRDPEEPDGFEPCVEFVDELTEQMDIALDEARGLGITTRQISVKQGDLVASGDKKVGSEAVRIPKPQSTFPVPVDNSRGHFRPNITNKPNARQPLTDFPGPGPYPHPYEFEIQNLVYEPWMLARNDETEFIPLDVVPFMYVDTPEGLDQLVRALMHPDVKEVAIDLEAHSIRSFSGFCCLMQISTRTLDAVVDTIKLRGQLIALQDVFTNPAVVKVLHGSRSDVVWLQRDFGLYLVNVFDTGEAARVLNYPSYGLAHLLDTFCKVKAQKHFQLADWRVRPLPSEMLRYAREDTHYLLGIYDRLKNELIDASSVETGNALQETLNNSAELSLQVFDKEQFTPNSYVHTLAHMNATLNWRQQHVFAALFDWRDQVAREVDESVHYVMPKRALLSLSMHIPLNMDQLTRACNPLPPVVRARAQQVLAVIAEAKEKAQPLVDLSLPDTVEAPTLAETIAKQHQTARAFLPVTPVYSLIQSPSLMTPSPEVTASPQALVNQDQLFVMAKWQSIPESRQATLRGAPGTRSPLSPVDPPMLHGGPRMLFEDAASESDEATDDDEEDAAVTTDQVLSNLHRIPYSSLLPVRKSRSRKSEPHVETAEEAAPQPLITDEILPIPKSLADIYAISNRNRRKNKEKKRGRGGDPADGGSEEDGGTGDEGGGRQSSTDGPRPPLSSHRDFMKSIGWLSAEDVPVEPGKVVVNAGRPERSQGNAAGMQQRFEYPAASSKSFGSELMGVEAGYGVGPRGRSPRGGRGGRGGPVNPYMNPGGAAGGRGQGYVLRTDGPRVGRGGHIFGSERSSGVLPPQHRR